MPTGRPGRGDGPDEWRQHYGNRLGLLMDSRPAYGWAQQATHMGQLKRAETNWDVFLELVGDASDKQLRRGRVHFVAGERHRESAWIFLERADRDVLDRFNEFSAIELWSLLESLGP